MESLLQKAKHGCLSALKLLSDQFVYKVHQIFEQIQIDITNLFGLRRMISTAWIQLKLDEPFQIGELDHVEDGRVALRVKFFVQEFMYFVQNFDTKETNFFFSNFLTAFLTHHLGWVSTVRNGNERQISLLEELFGMVGFLLMHIILI